MDSKQIRNQIVLGSLFGDEGKGNVVQWLCMNSLKPVSLDLVEVHKLDIVWFIKENHTYVLPGEVVFY